MSEYYFFISMLFIALTIYLIIRNEWVYRKRIAILNRSLFWIWELPSYNQMLFQYFWIWNMDFFTKNLEGYIDSDSVDDRSKSFLI